MKTRALLAATVLLLSNPGFAAPQVLIDTDFGGPGKAFSDLNAEKGTRITGSLPEGWSENTGWKSKVLAEYTPTSEAGCRFLRITQTSGDGLQFTAYGGQFLLVVSEMTALGTRSKSVV